MYDVERDDFVVYGEDPNDDPDDEEGSKPLRILTDFVIFDPAHGNELVSLGELLNGNAGRQFEAVGNVAPVFINEEDAGQDDDIVEESAKQMLRTTTIFNFTINYTAHE